MQANIYSLNYKKRRAKGTENGLPHGISFRLFQMLTFYYRMPTYSCRHDSGWQPGFAMHRRPKIKNVDYLGLHQSEISLATIYSQLLAPVGESCLCSFGVVAV